MFFFSIWVSSIRPCIHSIGHSRVARYWVANSLASWGCLLLLNSATASGDIASRDYDFACVANRLKCSRRLRCLWLFIRLFNGVKLRHPIPNKSWPTIRLLRLLDFFDNGGVRRRHVWTWLLVGPAELQGGCVVAVVSWLTLSYALPFVRIFDISHRFVCILFLLLLFWTFVGLVPRELELLNVVISLGLRTVGANLKILYVRSVWRVLSMLLLLIDELLDNLFVEIAATMLSERTCVRNGRELFIYNG